MGKVWVMMTRFSYGLWDMRELWDFTGNRVGGCSKPWVTTGYGLSQVWVRTESTVIAKLCGAYPPDGCDVRGLVGDTLCSRGSLP